MPLRNKLIRLAHANPDWRKEILPLLTAKKGPKGPPWPWDDDYVKKEDKGEAKGDKKDEKKDEKKDSGKPWEKGKKADDLFRDKVIRLAYENPAVRRPLLTLIKEGSWESGSTGQNGFNPGHVDRSLQHLDLPGEGSHVPPARDGRGRWLEDS